MIMDSANKWMRGAVVASTDSNIVPQIYTKLAMDAAYVQEAVGDVLSDGLAAVVAARPRDPVEYLGVYLMQQAARMDSSANDAEGAKLLVKQADEAAEKAAADTEATKEARAISEANAARVSTLESTLASSADVTQSQLSELANVICDHLRAGGVYIAKKAPLDGPAPASTGDDEEGEEDDGMGAIDAQIDYLAVSDGQEHMLSKHPLSNEGVTFDAWKVSGPEDADEDAEEEDDEDEEALKGNRPPPPLPELPVVKVVNTLRESRMLFLPRSGAAVPRLGQYMAVPFRYMSSIHAGCIPVPEPKEEGEGEDEGDGEGEDDGDDEEKDGEGGEEAAEGAAVSVSGNSEDKGPAPIPEPVQQEVLLALCVDTLGRDVRLGKEQEEAVKQWAGKVAAAYERSERVMYEMEYRRHEAQPAVEAVAREALESDEANAIETEAEDAASQEVEAAAKQAEEAAAKAAEEAVAGAGSGEEGEDAQGGDGGVADEEASGELPSDAEAAIRARHGMKAACKILGLDAIEQLRVHQSSRVLSPNGVDCRVMSGALHLMGCSQADLGDALARDQSKVRWGALRSKIGAADFLQNLASIEGQPELSHAGLARTALGGLVPAAARAGSREDGEDEVEPEADEGEGEGNGDGAVTGLSPFCAALVRWCKAALQQFDAQAAKETRIAAAEARRQAAAQAAAAKEAGGSGEGEGEAEADGDDEGEDEDD